MSVVKFVANRLLFRLIEVLQPVFLGDDSEFHYWLLGRGFEQFEQMYKTRRFKLLAQLFGIVPFLQILKPLAIVRLAIDLGETTTASLGSWTQHRSQRPQEFWGFVGTSDQSY